MPFITESPFALPPIYRAFIRDVELPIVQEEINVALKNTNMDYIPGWGRTHKLSTKTFLEDYISQHNLTTVDKIVTKHMQIYAEVLGLPTDVLSRASWLTQYDNGDYAHVHTHGDSHISGCLYTKTCGSDGTFFIACPVSTLEMASYPGYGMQHLVTPTEGMLVLFPSWYPHGVTTNETQESRMSLAFNYKLNRA